MANILIVSHIFPPAVDGGSRVIAKVGEYLKNSGHKIMVLTSNCYSTDDFTHRHKTIPKKDSDIFRLPVYTIFHKPLKRLSKVLAKGPIFKLLPLIKFLIACLKFHPQYIIAGPLPTTVILYARLIKLLTGARLVINASFHESDPEFHQPLLINSLKSADIIWTLTNHETEYFHYHFQIPSYRMINIGNGVDTDLITKVKKNKNSNLLYIGSFSAHKGLIALIDAFVKLPKDYTLTLAGQPTLYSRVIDEKIKNIPRIKVINNFKDHDLKKLLDNSGILISPSTQESFGLVLLEAIARGVPVIAADIPASVEIIQKSKTGLIFRQNDPRDLAAKIILLSNSPDYQKYSQNGPIYAIGHTWDRIGKALWQKLSSSSLS